MQPGRTPPPAVTKDGDLQFDGRGKQTRLRPLPPPSGSRIFITSAGEGSVPSWGQPLRERWPAPSLSDRGEGRSPFVALVDAACPTLGPEWLRSHSRRRLPPRQLEEVLPPTR
jgi:hypothetical protein